MDLTVDGGLQTKQVPFLPNFAMMSMLWKGVRPFHLGQGLHIRLISLDHVETRRTVRAAANAAQIQIITINDDIKCKLINT